MVDIIADMVITTITEIGTTLRLTEDTDLFIRIIVAIVMLGKRTSVIEISETHQVHVEMVVEYLVKRLAEIIVLGFEAIRIEGIQMYQLIV